MKFEICCKITDAKEYNQFCCFENSIYTLRISKNFKYWYYDLCDLIDFYADTNISLKLDVCEKDIKLARKLYGSHKYNEPVLREYESKVMTHSTTFDNSLKIIKENAIKSWNILNEENKDWEKCPIGSLLGDIEDFSNYVMLSLFAQNNEIITASRQKNKIDIDVNQKYTAGARFYLDAEKLAKDRLLLRDGEHIKVKNSIFLDKYLIWYETAERVGTEKITTPKMFFENSNKAFLNLFSEYKK